MPNKKRLLEQGARRVPQPNPSRLRDAVPRKRGYKIVAVSLYTDDAEELDRLTRELQQAGYPKANRSSVVQVGVRVLQRELAGKSRDELLRYFADHATKRAASA